MLEYKDIFPKNTIVNSYMSSDEMSNVSEQSAHENVVTLHIGGGGTLNTSVLSIEYLWNT